jgi:hypothetical protein
MLMAAKGQEFILGKIILNGADLTITPRILNVYIDG